MDSVISNPDSLIYEYIDRECAQDALKRHVSGKENKRLIFIAFCQSSVSLL